MSEGFDIHHQVKERRAEVDRRLAELGANILEAEGATEYAYRYRIAFEGDRRRLANYVEDVDGAEILSIGLGLELIKDLATRRRSPASTACRASSARTHSGTPGWRPSPTSISARRTLTGPIRSPTSRSSTTAS